MKIKNISKDKKDTKVKKKGQNKPRCGGLSALSCSSLKKKIALEHGHEIDLRV